MIELDHDGRYEKAITFDDKSYVLLDYDGKKTIKGNTLSGRSNEPFTLTFVEDCIDHILNENIEKIKDEYDYWKSRIQLKLMPFELVRKRQELGISIEEYKHKMEAGDPPIAQYEAALKDGRKFGKGDVIETWFEEPEPEIREYKTVPDKVVIPKKAGYEVVRVKKQFNTNIYREKYLDRLEKTLKKFLVVIGLEQFKQTFPDLTIYKDDKAKFIPVWGLLTFKEKFPTFIFREKDLKKMSNEDKQIFIEKTESGEYDEKYKGYYE